MNPWNDVPPCTDGFCARAFKNDCALWIPSVLHDCFTFSCICCALWIVVTLSYFLPTTYDRVYIIWLSRVCLGYNTIAWPVAPTLLFWKKWTFFPSPWHAQYASEVVPVPIVYSLSEPKEDSAARPEWIETQHAVRGTSEEWSVRYLVNRCFGLGQNGRLNYVVFCFAHLRRICVFGLGHNWRVNFVVCSQSEKYVNWNSTCSSRHWRICVFGLGQLKSEWRGI